MQYSCDCDGCYWGDDCQAEPEVAPKVETYDDDDCDYTPRCPGYTTWTTKHECNSLLDREEERRGICDECVSKRDHQLQVEDDAAEAAHQRQLNMEEFQARKNHGDFDDDGDNDGDREEEGQAPGYLELLSEEVLSKQIAEDKKKFNF